MAKEKQKSKPSPKALPKINKLSIKSTDKTPVKKAKPGCSLSTPNVKESASASNEHTLATTAKKASTPVNVKQPKIDYLVRSFVSY